MEKWKSKVRKLLALAQSDNPHEAERARVQAEKIMAKYQIGADELAIMTVDCNKSYRRRQPKLSEAYLIQSICKISGCFSSGKVDISRRGRSYRYKSTPCFTGLQPDAELAAYTFDVLYGQLVAEQNALKRKYEVTAGQIEAFSRSWVAGVCGRIEAIFPVRKLPESVEKAKAKANSDMTKADVNECVSREHSDVLGYLGHESGQAARLNIPAESTSEPILQIEMSQHE